MLLSQLHIRFMLDRQREHLDRTYSDHELDAARRGRARSERALVATKKRLKAALRDLAETERAKRTAEAERDTRKPRPRDPDRYPAPPTARRRRAPPARGCDTS